MKKVSVIIPYKTDRGWLSHAIASVESQSYKNIELILSHGDCPKSINVNQGISKATGDFIKILDEDDWLTNDCIEYSVLGITSSHIIHGNAFVYWPTKAVTQYFPLDKTPTLSQLLTHNSIYNPTVMYRAQIFDLIGMYDETLTTIEEYEFHLRALSAGLRIGYVNHFMAYYRRHDNQKSLGINVNQIYRQNILKQIKQQYGN